MDFKEIKDLIVKEQLRQNGKFLGDKDLASFVKKIELNAEFVIYYIEGRCAGFVAFYCNDVEKKQSYITLLLTEIEHRGKKIGAWLIDAALSSLTARGFYYCSLEVKKDNEFAFEIYKNKGFIIKGENKISWFMQKTLMDR